MKIKLAFNKDELMSIKAALYSYVTKLPKDSIRRIRAKNLADRFKLYQYGLEKEGEPNETP